MPSKRREFYQSSNGDSWHLCRNPMHEAVVVHEPNELRKLIAGLVYP
jgi:hypothetical protein